VWLVLNVEFNILFMYLCVHGEKIKSANMGDKTGFATPSHIKSVYCNVQAAINVENAPKGSTSLRYKYQTGKECLLYFVYCTSFCMVNHIMLQATRCVNFNCYYSLKSKAFMYCNFLSNIAVIRS